MNGIRRGLAGLSVLALLISLTSACGKRGDWDVWKEEVRLMNGDLVVVDRHNRYGDSPDLSASHGPLTWAEMNWEYKGKKYHWEQRGVGTRSMQLDDHGRFVIVTKIGYCWAWREHHRPKSAYVVFRSEGDAWVEIPIEEVPLNTVFNLTSSSDPPHEKPKKYIKETDWKFKDDIDPLYNKIIPGLPGGPGCLG